MDFNKLRLALDWLGKNRYSKLNVMGGEPLLYSKFLDFFDLAQRKEFSLTLFTNGTVAFPSRLVPRDKDTVTFNARFLNHPSFKKNLPSFVRKFHHLGFDLVITADCEIESVVAKLDDFLGKIKEWEIDKKRIGFTVSLDCSANIFKAKEKLNNDLLILTSFFFDKGISLGSDHPVPDCFFLPQVRLAFKKRKIFNSHRCLYGNAGLLDANFYLGFCSVYPGNKFPFFSKEGKPISFGEYKKKIAVILEAKIKAKKTTLCKGCVDWGEKCNGGCFPKAKK